MIYVTGDTHGTYDIQKLKEYSWTGCTKNDYLIICGDVGVCWYGNIEDTILQTWYRNLPLTILFIDGNHENFDLLNNYPIERWNGGNVHFITPTHIHLMRGQVFTIEGKTFFTMGGARSTDKEMRQVGVSWWEEEMPSYQEYETALHNLEKYDNKVDYIITHCCSSVALKAIDRWYVTDQLTSFFWELEKTVDYKQWFL